jgi:long-chain acyl-CoA synthetase
MDALKKYAGENAIAYGDERELLDHEQIRAVFDQEFRSYSKTASAPEKIRDFRLLPEAFTVENDLLTPSLKTKRKAIERRYAEVIEAMYRDFRF